jgi:hypothetical protein
MRFCSQSYSGSAGWQFDDFDFRRLVSEKCLYRFQTNSSLRLINDEGNPRTVIILMELAESRENADVTHF